MFVFVDPHHVARIGDQLTIDFDPHVLVGVQFLDLMVGPLGVAG
jgi:hypothetical protein